ARGRGARGRGRGRRPRRARTGGREGPETAGSPGTGAGFDPLARLPRLRRRHARGRGGICGRGLAALGSRHLHLTFCLQTALFRIVDPVTTPLTTNSKRRPTKP